MSAHSMSCIKRSEAIFHSHKPKFVTHISSDTAPYTTQNQEEKLMEKLKSKKANTMTDGA